MASRPGLAGALAARDETRELAPRATTLTRRYLPYLLLVLSLAATSLVRWRLIETPLERDEGEYAYVAQRVLAGDAPYVGAYTMKFPGTALAYAAGMTLFGQTTIGIHRMLWLVNLVSACLVFLIGRRWWGATPGAVAAGLFSLMTLDVNVLGFTANAEHFVLLPALSAVLFLLAAERASRPDRWHFAAGLGLGLAILCKQPGVCFVLFPLLYRFRERGRAGNLQVMAGLSLPLALALLWIAHRGSWARFWFWTITYASRYASQLPFDAGLISVFWNSLLSMLSAAPLWLPSAAAFGILFRRPEQRAARRFLGALLVPSCLAIAPGWNFREHYFVYVLPFFSLAGASLLRTVSVRSAASLLLVAVSIFVFIQRNYLFFMTPNQVVQDVFIGNPFVLAIELGDVLRRQTSESDRVAVVGSDPEILFYAQRRSATGYLYSYPLCESQPFAEKMQQEMIAEIESARPRFLVFVGSSLAWTPLEAPPDAVGKWFVRYMANYQLIRVAEFFTGERDFRWVSETDQGDPRGGQILLLRRKD